MQNINENGASGRNLLKIYNNNAELLSMIKVPGNEIFDCSWAKHGLKLALAVDSSMYFVSLKPKLSWCLLTESLIFLHQQQQLDPKSNCPTIMKTLIFWELKTNKRYKRRLDNFVQMTSSQHYCCSVVRMIDDDGDGDKIDDVSIDNTINVGNGIGFLGTDTHSNRTIKPNLNDSFRKCKVNRLNLYNSVGTLIDSHLVNFEIEFCSMNSSTVVVTSKDSYQIWCFKSIYYPTSIIGSLKNSLAENLLNELSGISGDVRKDEVQRNEQIKPILIVTEANTRITCLTVSEKYFLIGLDSGVINQFLLPNGSCINKITIDNVPMQISLNRNSSKFSIIDRTSRLSIYDFDSSNEETLTEGKWIDFTLNDIWDFKWEIENNDLIVVAEKNKLIVIDLGAGTMKKNFKNNNNNGELDRESNIGNESDEDERNLFVMESKPFRGYLCEFRHLSIRTIQFDQLMIDIDTESNNIDIDDYFETNECSLVTNLKNLISKDSMTEAINYTLRQTRFPQLWSILGRESLLQQDIETAYLSMIKNKDYKGLQLIKRLNKFKDINLQRAEILAFINRFDEAEQIYLESDRADLALNMNKVIANYIKVDEFLQRYNFQHHHKEVEENNYRLGEFYSEHSNWTKAEEYFEKSNAYEKLIECYIHLEKFDSIVSLIDKINDVEYLQEIGRFLESVGDCDHSVQAYCKAGKYDMAVNVCINLGEWKTAMILAKQYQIFNLDEFLKKFSRSKSEENLIESIEFYR
ncbi:hypothetical protein QR98_0093590 [Sarcoptes scabiei]|nr:hypothetical protein QR98_0093590 [Sarcoptes scabiei]